MSHEASPQIITPPAPDKARILKALFYGWSTVSGMGFLGLTVQWFEAGGRVPASQISSSLVFVLLGSFLGLAAIGGPAWWLLYWAGCRRMAHAVSLGALLGGAALLGLVWYATGFQGDEGMPWGPSQWLRLGLATTSAAVASALAGWVIWRTAYR